jgi:hypothetical protein
MAPLPHADLRTSRKGWGGHVVDANSAPCNVGYRCLQSKRVRQAPKRLCGRDEERKRKAADLCIAWLVLGKRVWNKGELYCKMSISGTLICSCEGATFNSVHPYS